MKVDMIELYHISIPLPADFYPAWIPGYPQDLTAAPWLNHHR